MKPNISRESDHQQHSIRLLVFFLLWFSGPCSGEDPGNSSKNLQVQSNQDKGENIPSFLTSQPTPPQSPSSSSFVPDFLSAINKNNQKSQHEEEQRSIPLPQAQVQRRPPFSNFNSIDEEQQRSNDRERLRNQQENTLDRGGSSDDFLTRDRSNTRVGQGFGDRGDNRTTFKNNRFQPDSVEDQGLPFGRNPRPQDPFSSFGSTTPNRNRVNNNQDGRQRLPDQGFTSFNNNNNQRGQTPAFPFGGTNTPNFNFNQNNRNTLIKEP